MGVVAVAVNTNAYTQVIELHRRNKKWLGQLPYAAFDRYADDGTLLGVLAGSELRGYALYGLPRNQVALIHLCVQEQARGEGVARSLIDEIVRRHQDRSGIRLRCRRDFPAHTMWPHLDFEPQGDIVGHSLEGHLLTQWWRDFGHPTLFSASRTVERERVALDTDVFVDLNEDRPAGHASRAMIAASWLADEFEFTITKQVTQEIDNNEDPDIRRRNRAQAEGFVRANAHEAEWRPYEKRLLAALGDRTLTAHDRGDVRHAARAAAIGAKYLVSRDEAQRKLLRSIAETELHLSIVSPAELIQIGHERASSAYEFRSIQATRFGFTHLSASAIDDTVTRFVNTSDGEPATEFRSSLHDVLVEPDLWIVEIIEADGEAIGLVAYRDQDDHREVALLRVCPPHDLTLARQVAFQMRDGARRAGRRGVVVTDRCLSRPVQEALAQETFALDTTGWVAVSLDLIGTRSELRRSIGSVPSWFQPKRDWATLRGAFDREMDSSVVAEIEDRLWPLKVVDADLPTYLVPILASFAEDLFDADLKSQTLFPRADSLGISREHVYYRSPAPLRPSRAPARILWYVTQERRRPGTGTVRACSQLVEVVVDRPDRLHRRFGRYGVWRKSDVRGAARNGEVLALRFANTEVFEQPVRLARLGRAAQELGCPRPFVQSPWVMPARLFEWTYRKGRGDDTST